MPSHFDASPNTIGPVRRALSSAATVVSASIAHAPENAAYGLMALAPLGAAFAPQAMALALLGAVVANTVASLVGGGRLVSGPRASLALLTASLCAALLTRLVPLGDDAPYMVLLLLALGIVAAGALQVLFGLLKLGNIVKFTPHPVRIGLMSGVGLLLIATSLPVVLGYGFGTGLAAVLNGAAPAATLVGLCAMLAAWSAARLNSPLPAVLVGLLAAALLHIALAHSAWAVGLSGPVGVPALPEHWFTSGRAVLALGSPSLQILPLLGLVGSYALTVAVLATLDTLLTTSVVDGRLRQSRDANRELCAQGLANVAAALAGGQANSPSMPRSMALAVPLTDARHSVVWYAGAGLLLLLAVPDLLGQLPSSAIGGILLLQGLQMVSTTLWRTPWNLWGRRRQHGSSYDQAQRRLLADNWGVAAAVALNTVVLGLAQAVLIGASFAVLLFVRANMREVVRRVWTGENRRSLKMRTPATAAALQRQGRHLAVLELEGSLFFGTADALRSRLEVLAEAVDTAILDLHQVGEIDATAARILLETGEDWARRGKHLVVAEWVSGDARRRTIEAMAMPGGAAGLTFANDTDTALEQAEDMLLERSGGQFDAQERLSLGQTMLGRGLDDAEIALLASLTQILHFPRDTILFKAGDPGDSLYISLQGHIGLRLPGSARRLASFAPGVSMGEMSVLDHRTRSAEAITETQVCAMRLSVEAFDQLKLEHPVLAAKLLNNISLHLAERVRVLTGDLASWVSRTAVGRVAPVVMAEPLSNEEMNVVE
jgi:SulP family sulfate permease